MAEFILKESQLELIKQTVEKDSEIRLAEEKWNRFTKEEKQFVIEFLIASYPKKTKLIKEHWLNTVGDIVGIFDPTGVVDLINGISYITQGETLFGFLSIISAVPYVGDAVAKPVMAALKLGKPSTKVLNSIAKTAKAGDTVKASADLAKLAGTSKMANTFMNGVLKIGPTLKNIVNRIPGGFVTRGLKNTIIGWIDLFGKAGTRSIVTKQVMGNLAKRLPRMTPARAAIEFENLIKAVKSTPGVFTGYRTTKGILSWKTVFGGMPQLMGRNKSVRALARQSKWWLGFLDYVGLGNFVGPEELSKKLGGEDEMIKKMEEYNKTEDAERNFKDQYGEGETESSENNQTSKTNTTTKNDHQSDPLSGFLRKILLGALNPIPGM